MFEGIDQPQPPGGQQQYEVQGCTPTLVLGADQVDQREQQRQPTAQQATGDQPGSEVAPLDLEAVEVGDIAQQRAWLKAYEESMGAHE